MICGISYFDSATFHTHLYVSLSLACFYCLFGTINTLLLYLLQEILLIEIGEVKKKKGVRNCEEKNENFEFERADNNL